ncbi:MAG: metal ABC transporter solute-binding protein, Zn/Mn family [Candidatus Humimicrobiaceae bacterium]
MRFIKKIITFLTLFSILLLLIPAACSNENLIKDDKTDIIEVVVSIPPQAEFVEAILKEKASVTIMIPPGASPHTYEPKSSQLVSVSNAELYVKVGTPIEFENSWLKKIEGMNKTMLIADCSKNIKLIDTVIPTDKESEDKNVGSDPHIWLSLKNAAIMTENIYDAVIKIDPQNSDYYEKNKTEYTDRITKLDDRLRDLFESSQNKIFMSYHDSWAYFARDYGLTQVSIEEEGKEPSLQKIKEIINLAESENIKIIFASPELNTSSAKIIAQEIGGFVIFISPLAKNYLENMTDMSAKLYEELKNE